MRRNQVSISITRYGDEVPKNYPNERQIINVYSDSNNLFEALTNAYVKAVDTIAEWQRVAVRTDIITNADNEMRSGKLLGRKYEETMDLQYPKERLKMNKELLFYIDNAEEIASIIKNSSNKEEAREKLKLKFNLSDKQIFTVFRTRFDLFTKDVIEDVNNDIMMIEKWIKENK